MTLPSPGHAASRVGAIAEYRERIPDGTHRALVLNLGPEVTATALINGEIEPGADGLFGTIGALAYPDGLGNVTTIQDVIGVPASKRRCAETTGNEVGGFRQILQRAPTDATAQQILDDQTEVFAFACSWLLTIANPSRFVVSGAVADYGETLRSRLHARIVELTDPRLLQNCTIDFSSLGRQGWIRGGVYAALDHQQTNDTLTDD